MSNNTPDYNDNLYFDCTAQDNDLTAQWRKGELPEGYYYVKDGENMIAEYLDGYFYNNGEPMTSFSGGVDSVLAPVPSYQWVIDHSFKRFSQRLFEKTLEDNKKLKELLKECRDEVNPYIEVIGGKKTFKNLIDKIDEVLK